MSLADQWLRGSTAIDGETGQTYRVTSEDAGSLISVRVTATKTGYVPVSKVSAPTARVR